MGKSTIGTEYYHECVKVRNAKHSVCENTIASEAVCESTKEWHITDRYVGGVVGRTLSSLAQCLTRVGESTIVHSMVGENTKDKSPLLPERRAQADFFVCDILDAVPKADIASMEHPIFSLSTKPDKRIRRYEQNENWLEITPSVKGLATIHDRDILIYCISQIIGALNRNQKISRTVHFKAFDLLSATNRNTSGTGYEQLRAALLRLAGTRIETNITTGDTEQLDGFGMIESYRIVRESREGRMQEMEVTLSDWVFNAIRHNEVLTLHPDYFRLRKPLERRMYEIARKHCGRQKTWKITLPVLHKKCGSASTLKEFKRLVNNIAKADSEHEYMPDYAVTLEDDAVIFHNRNTIPALEENHTDPLTDASDGIHLKPETYDAARQAAPGWDVYVLEQEWREWITEPPRNADAAFLGFCRKVYEKRGEA